MAELKASTIDDIAADLGIERVNIFKNEDVYIVQFGPLSYRQTMQIGIWTSDDEVKAKFEAAKGHPLSEVPSPVPEAKPSPAVTPATAKGKQKKMGEVKRKIDRMVGL